MAPIDSTLVQAALVAAVLLGVPYVAGTVVMFALSPRSDDKVVRNERRKLTATYCNTIGTGFAVTGVVGPMASYLYGTTMSSREPWQLAVEIIALFGASITAHGIGRKVLGGLEP